VKKKDTPINSDSTFSRSKNLYTSTFSEQPKGNHKNSIIDCLLRLDTNKSKNRIVRSREKFCNHNSLETESVNSIPSTSVSPSLLSSLTHQTTTSMNTTDNSNKNSIIILDDELEDSTLNMPSKNIPSQSNSINVPYDNSKEIRTIQQEVSKEDQELKSLVDLFKKEDERENKNRIKETFVNKEKEQEEREIEKKEEKEEKMRDKDDDDDDFLPLAPFIKKNVKKRNVICISDDDNDDDDDDENDDNLEGLRVDHRRRRSSLNRYLSENENEDSNNELFSDFDGSDGDGNDISADLEEDTEEFDDNYDYENRYDCESISSDGSYHPTSDYRSDELFEEEDHGEDAVVVDEKSKFQSHSENSRGTLSISVPIPNHRSLREPNINNIEDCNINKENIPINPLTSLKMKQRLQRTPKMTNLPFKTSTPSSPLSSPPPNTSIKSIPYKLSRESPSISIPLNEINKNINIPSYDVKSPESLKLKVKILFSIILLLLLLLLLLLILLL